MSNFRKRGAPSGPNNYATNENSPHGDHHSTEERHYSSYHQSKRRNNHYDQNGESRDTRYRRPNVDRRRREDAPSFRGAGMVGGRLPDRWTDYIPYSKYFGVPSLRLKGVLPCKTFLDKCFDSRLPQYREGTFPGAEFWRPSTLFEVKTFDRASTDNLHDPHRVTNGGVLEDPPQDECRDDERCWTLTNNPLKDCQIDEQPQTCSMKEGSSAVGVVVNLCLTERHYSVPDTRNLCEYFRFSVDGGGTLPRLTTILAFIELFASISRRFPDRLAALHCTHGVNRTGFFSAVLLLAFGDYTPEQAAELFHRARGHPINRQELFDELQSLQKNTFSNPNFESFIQEISKIYSVDSPPHSDTGVVLRLESVPKVIQSSDLFITLLESHHSDSSFLYQPFGLLEIHVNDDDLSNQCSIELTFTDSSSAQRFEERWPTISLANCLRSSVLPLNMINQREEFEDALQHIRLVRSF